MIYPRSGILYGYEDEGTTAAYNNADDSHKHNRAKEARQKPQRDSIHVKLKTGKTKLFFWTANLTGKTKRKRSKCHKNLRERESVIK